MVTYKTAKEIQIEAAKKQAAKKKKQPLIKKQQPHFPSEKKVVEEVEKK